jgi:lipoic acid synthetase
MAARDLKLDHAVITSVTRDDLSDGGAGHFAETVREVARLCPEASVEVLVPDFQGNAKSVETVLRAGPDVFNHNLETVKRLYGALRPGASYERSLNLLERARGIAPNIVAKSGIMVGAGETVDELKELFDDLSGRGLHILTIGQYLRPTPLHHEVDRYLEPEEFDFLKSLAKGAGIPSVVSGPLVRSSFKAKEAMDSITPNGHEHI